MSFQVFYGPEGTFHPDSFDTEIFELCKKNAAFASVTFGNTPVGIGTQIKYVFAGGAECPISVVLAGSNPFGLAFGGGMSIPLGGGAPAPAAQMDAASQDDTLISAYDLTFNGQLVFSATGIVPISAQDLLDTIIVGGNSGDDYRALISLFDDDTSVTGSESAETIEVGAGNDTVVAGGSNDTVLKWRAGDLTYDGGDGIDTLTFRAGTDAVFPTPFVQPLIVDLAAGTGQSPYGGTLTLTSVENIVGTSQADSITGDDGPNVIGDGVFDIGADTVDAMGGNDVVRLGPFARNFSVDGGDGIDELTFSIEDGTTAFTSVVLDLLNPALGTGPFEGASIANFEKYSASTLVSVGPDIFVFGGSNGDDVVTGQNGTAFFPVNEPFEDILSGRGGNDTMSGERGRDSLDGGAGDDSLDGGIDNDSLRGGNGDDTVLGGLGNDTAVFAGVRTDYTIDFDAPFTTVTGPDGTDSVSGVETLQFDDEAVETPVLVSIADASLVEGSGNFIAFTVSLTRDITQDVTVTVSLSDGSAVGGVDFISAPGQVTIRPGQPTSAVFLVQVLNDTIVEADETFTATLSNPTGGADLGSHSVATGTIIDNDVAPPPPPEVDQTITGGAASELIFGSALRDLIQGLGGADTVFAGDGNDVLEGGGDRDFLVAEGGDDTGFGGDGDDVLFGGSGADSLLGEADVDFLFGEAGADTLDGGAGNDRIHIVRDDVIAAGGEGVFDVLVVLDAAGPLTIDLGNVANQNTTGSGPVVTGIEAVDASLSNQPVNVRGAALNGFGNVLFTSGLNDTVTGSSLADIILGGGGDDILDGGAGDDTLIADAGSDTLTGGAGADDFFHPGAGSTMRVADFAPGSDQVVLLASSGLTADQALAQTLQQGADALLALPSSGGTIVLVGIQASALSAGDFEVV